MLRWPIFCNSAIVFLNSSFQKEEKARKLAAFQKRVQSRIRDLKRQNDRDKLNDTLVLNDTENILMNCTDPMRKAPMVQSSSVMISGVRF